jgi:hypothetical protein
LVNQLAVIFLYSMHHMKTFKPYFLPQLCAVFLLVIALQSCSENPGSWKNEQIKAGKRDDFHELNNQALKALKAGDVKALAPIISKELDENTYTNRQAELIGNRLTDNEYVLRDEYYVVNEYRDFDTIKTTGSGINSHAFYYPGTAREMYWAFFEPRSSANKYLITLMYAKLDYGWKLTMLDLAPYTINGKTAPELFKLAKDNYDKKQTIEAINNITLAMTCLKPSEIWRYTCENDAHDFYPKILEKANTEYKFPYVLNDVPTKPRIIKIYTKSTNEGTYPMVYYLSKIKVSDTVAIKNENIQIRKALSKVMPGFDQDKKYVLYSAFNDKSKTSKYADHFDMVDKLQ